MLKLTNFVIRGFKRSQNEYTFYILRKGDAILIVLVFVDDLIFIGNDKT